MRNYLAFEPGVIRVLDAVKSMWTVVVVLGAYACTVRASM